MRFGDIQRNAAEILSVFQRAQCPAALNHAAPRVLQAALQLGRGQRHPLHYFGHAGGVVRQPRFTAILARDVNQTRSRIPNHFAFIFDGRHFTARIDFQKIRALVLLVFHVDDDHLVRHFQQRQ